MSNLERTLKNLSLDWEVITKGFYKIKNPKNVCLTEMLSGIDAAVVYCDKIENRSKKIAVLWGELRFVLDLNVTNEEKEFDLLNEQGVFALESYWHERPREESIDTIFEKGVEI